MNLNSAPPPPPPRTKNKRRYKNIIFFSPVTLPTGDVVQDARDFCCNRKKTYLKILIVYLGEKKILSPSPADVIRGFVTRSCPVGGRLQIIGEPIGASEVKVLTS